MNDSSIKLPLYSKLALIILGLVGLGHILYIGQEIIVPVIFAVILAILLNPFVNYLCSKRISRIMSISIVVFLTIIFIGGLSYFIVSQISELGDALPQFGQKFEAIVSDFLQWVSVTFKVSHYKINTWITKTRKEIDGMAVIGQALDTLKGALVVVIMPVYIFIILYYKPLFLEFIEQLFKSKDRAVVAEVLSETKSLIQKYLVGLSIEAVIVAILNTAGLMILGIPYAALLGIIGALLNVIPYIGGVIAIALPMLVAIATKTPGAAFWVFMVYMLVQFIDNQFIVPKIVASKVKINALVSIIVVLIGGALWGLSGMFLALPLTAIIKVIFDRIDTLKPFGYLLGDVLPARGVLKIENEYKEEVEATGS